MKDFNFFGDGRIVDGRILQAVAERFVIQKNPGAGRDELRRGGVPIVDPFVQGHGGGKVVLSRQLTAIS